MKLRQISTTVLLSALLLTQQNGWSQETKKELTSISMGQLKKILGELNYKYQNAPVGFLVKLAKPGDNKVTYDVFIESFDGGQAVVIGANFLTLEIAEDNAADAARLLKKVNDWNAGAALSRGMRRPQMNMKGQQVFIPRLEADLDCSMGVTAQDVNRLIQRFATSLKDFEAFVK